MVDNLDTVLSEIEERWHSNPNMWTDAGSAVKALSRSHAGLIAALRMGMGLAYCQADRDAVANILRGIRVVNYGTE